VTPSAGLRDGQTVVVSGMADAPLALALAGLVLAAVKLT
jgi:hypothetical protein